MCFMIHICYAMHTYVYRGLLQTLGWITDNLQYEILYDLLFTRHKGAEFRIRITRFGSEKNWIWINSERFKATLIISFFLYSLIRIQVFSIGTNPIYFKVRLRIRVLNKKPFSDQKFKQNIIRI